MPERELLVRILGDDRDLQRALGNTERRVESLDNRTAAFGKNIKTAFAAAGITVGIASFSRGMEQIIQSSIDFEEAFAGVRKTVDASESEFAELAAGFREMAKEIPITAVELARVGEAAGQLGVAKSNILEFTRTVADLAATTDLTTDTAADAFARLTNITGLPQDQVSNLGSAVVDLGNKLAATESEIVDFATRIAGAGRQAKLTDAQIVAIAGAFRSVGVESEAGGTAVQKVLLAMTSATLSGGKELAAFARVAGQSTDEFRRAFSADSGAAFASFVEGLERIREEGGNAFKTLDQLGLRDQRLVRAFLSMSSNSQLLTDSLRIGSTAFEENTALTEEAGKRYQTTASQIQIFKNNVNDLAITLGDELVAELNDAVEAGIALHGVLEDIKSLAPIEVPIAVPISILFQARTPGGATDLLGRIGEEIRGGLESLTAAGKSPFEGLENMFRGEPGLFRFFPGPTEERDPITEGVEKQADKERDRADKIEDAAADAKRDRNRARKAFDAFVKGMGLKLDKAQLTEGLGNDLAALRELERAILRQIEREGKTFKLVDRLTKTRLQIASLVKQQAADAKQAGEDAFNATIDALDLNLEMAQATKSLADDQAALRVIENRILARIKAEGETTDLLRELFRVRQEQAAVAQQLIEQARERRQGDIFERLGLTREGDERVPGGGALRARARSLLEQVEGTALDTKKNRRILQGIINTSTKDFREAGRAVRQAALDMLNEISGALDDEGTAFGGEITKGGIRSTQALLRGLDLTEEERRIIQQRNLGVSGRRGLAAFGVGIGGGGSTGTTGAEGFGGGLAGAMIINGPITVVTNDPNDLMKKLQKKARKTSGGRRGRHGGANLGLQ